MSVVLSTTYQGASYYEKMLGSDSEDIISVTESDLLFYDSEDESNEVLF